MATGIKNKLTGQIGENLVSAMLGTKGFYASPCSGNVPGFDITAVCSETLKSFPVQVKTSNGGALIQSSIDKWVNHSFDENNAQSLGDPLRLSNPDMVWIIVLLKDNDLKTVRYFICTQSQIQTKMIDRYRDFLNRIDSKRPRNRRSLMCVLREKDLNEFEDNWKLLNDTVATSMDRNGWYRFMNAYLK
jgi:hypothetical protein